MNKIRFLLLLCLVAGMVSSFAQVAINDNGASADQSAILDLQSTNKGLLLPRIDFNDRPDPAAPGLMVFVTANGPYGNNAVYVYNGISWRKLNFSGIGIGDQMEGGIVFWLDATGTHGLVSAVADQGEAEWGCDGTLIGPGAQHTGIGSGDTNTAAIITGCPTPGIAADLCKSLTIGGYTDWYLPAVDELDSMYMQRTVIGGFSTNWYWSSSETAIAENPADAAWFVDFSNGTPEWTTKAYSFVSVRCIRKF